VFYNATTTEQTLRAQSNGVTLTNGCARLINKPTYETDDRYRTPELACT